MLILFAGVACAQTTINWRQNFPQASPPARESAAAAYDSAQGEVVLFGGAGNATDGFGAPGSVRLDDTWVWNGSNWAQKSPQTNPSARIGHAMAYDAAHGQVVLFGGLGIAPTETVFNDTWVWDGSNWSQKSPQTIPPGRYFSAMAYDSVHRQVVLFGGGNGNSTPLGDTWVWDGSNWTQKFPETSPPGRFSYALAYDTGQSQIVLFGGDWGMVGQNDIWVWDGSNWTQKFAQTSPSPRDAPLMVFDSALGHLVLFGGEANNNQSLNDTWEWDGSNWTQESPQNSPPTRLGEALAYDSGHGQTVLFGGQIGTGQLLADTWTYGIGPAPGPVPSLNGVISASAFGGFSSVALGSWVEIYGSNLAPHTRGWTSADFDGIDAPTALDGVSVSFGGQAAFVDYISPTQVNVQLPGANLAPTATQQLTLTNANQTSAPVDLVVNAAEPGLLAPPSFKIGGNQYVVAQHLDGSYVIPTGAITGVTSSPAQPGETIVIYGIGFGEVAGNIFPGSIVEQENQLIAPLQVLFGQMPAQLSYFGLALNLIGIYQFNIVVPAVANSNLVPLTFNLGGVASTQTLFTAVQQ